MGNCVTLLARGGRRSRGRSASSPPENAVKTPPGGASEGLRGGKGGARVKIVLTKEAAAQLLACGGGGGAGKMLERMAGGLEKIGGGRSGLSLCGDEDIRWRPTLETIRESPDDDALFSVHLSLDL